MTLPESCVWKPSAVIPLRSYIDISGHILRQRNHWGPWHDRLYYSSSLLTFFTGRQVRLVRSIAQRMYPDCNMLPLKLVDVGVCSSETQVALIVVLEVDLRSYLTVLPAHATDLQTLAGILLVVFRSLARIRRGRNKGEYRCLMKLDRNSRQMWGLTGS